MLHTPHQYTPRQLLESARRAEADGNLELAGQLYWHLSETHPHTAEGAEAHAGLARMGFGTPQPPPAVAHAPGPPRNGQGMLGGPQAGGSPYAHAPYAMPQVVTGQRAAPTTRVRKLPVVRRGYGFGYVLASLLGVAGWILAVLAVLLPIAGATGLLPVALGLPVSLSVGLALAIAGGVALLFGQIAHAVFDQANATREFVAIERAKWGGEQP